MENEIEEKAVKTIISIKTEISHKGENCLSCGWCGGGYCRLFSQRLTHKWEIKEGKDYVSLPFRCAECLKAEKEPVLF